MRVRVFQLGAAAVSRKYLVEALEIFFLLSEHRCKEVLTERGTWIKLPFCSCQVKKTHELRFYLPPPRITYAYGVLTTQTYWHHDAHHHHLSDIIMIFPLVGTVIKVRPGAAAASRVSLMLSREEERKEENSPPSRITPTSRL